ncbi:MAG: hypothetical protein U1F22_05505 [Lysobacterales bacterium]
MRPAFAALLVFALSPRLAAAEAIDIEQRLTPEQRHATGLDTLSTEQLALLNRLLREQAAAADGADAPRVAPAARADGSPRAAAGLIGLDDQPIHSRVKGRIAGWAPGSEFVLENGQTWKVLKGEATLRTPRQNPEIDVIPGLAGRWFLQVDETLPKARVYRVD